MDGGSFLSLSKTDSRNSRAFSHICELVDTLYRWTHQSGGGKVSSSECRNCVSKLLHFTTGGTMPVHTSIAQHSSRVFVCSGSRGESMNVITRTCELLCVVLVTDCVRIMWSSVRQGCICRPCSAVNVTSYLTPSTGILTRNACGSGPVFEPQDRHVWVHLLANR